MCAVLFEVAGEDLGVLADLAKVYRLASRRPIDGKRSVSKVERDKIVDGVVQEKLPRH